MKNTARTLWHTLYRHRSTSCLLALLSSLSLPAAQAETITIGKGKGVLWEGLPFKVYLRGNTNAERMDPSRGLISINDNGSSCQENIDLKTIAGYTALELAPGVGLIPRASGTATYYAYKEETASRLTGTFGLPKTEGIGYQGAKVTSPNGYSWCLSPVMWSSSVFYTFYKDREVWISGTWVLVADGNQMATEVKLPSMWASSSTTIAR